MNGGADVIDDADERMGREKALTGLGQGGRKAEEGQKERRKRHARRRCSDGQAAAGEKTRKSRASIWPKCSGTPQAGRLPMY